MEKQISAVEWFYIQMENLRVKAETTNMDGNDIIIAKVKLLHQAKQMEKEQIMKARQDIFHTGNLTAEQYYNKTFKSE